VYSHLHTLLPVIKEKDNNKNKSPKPAMALQQAITMKSDPKQPSFKKSVLRKP